MDLGNLTSQPAVVAALVAGTVGLATVSVNAIVTTILHSIRIKADRDIAKYKAELDRKLRKADFAEEVLAGFYEAERDLVHIRSPGSFGSENDDRQGRDAEEDAVRRETDIYYPTIRRLRDYNPFFSAFFAKRFRAMALFGSEAALPFDQFWQVIVSIQVSAGFLVREATRGNSGMPQATIDRQLDVIWARHADDDAQAAMIAAALLSAETIFGAPLRSL